MNKLIYQGSAKDIYETTNDEVIFEFTDHYSVFDYGRMPNIIPEKGQNLATITTLLFKELEQVGVKSHLKKKIDNSKIKVQKYHIPNIKEKNEYDYSYYKGLPENSLIPLEVVFRWGLPKGSSLLSSETEFKRLYGELPFYEGAKFKEPIIGYYTKLEKIDRKLELNEMKNISGLTPVEFNQLEMITKKIAYYLKKRFLEGEYTLWDGKLEFAFGKRIKGNREIILIDSIGPDELRLTRNNNLYSKEILRQYYIKTPWYQELTNLKEKHPTSFLNHMQSAPNSLDKAHITLAKNIYQEIATFLKEKSKLQKVLILGKGGREHALAQHLESDKTIAQIFVAPGNPGMESYRITPTKLNNEEVLKFIQANKINLVIIGPEDLIDHNLNTQLRDAGVNVYAPSKKAAILESSKKFSKEFMQKYEIPTATFQTFNTKNSAIKFIKNSGWKSFVIKKSGLCAGKGVFISTSMDNATSILNKHFSQNENIIIEKQLVGREVSYFAICLEERYKFLASACDYKRLKDNDMGPNTGGMGCYSPAYWLTNEQIKHIEKTILSPTLTGMKKENIPFFGTLFIGLMMTDEGAKVLEYNVRFGDPETQTFLPRIKNSLLPILKAVATKDANKFKELVIISEKVNSVHIVKAAHGYPGLNGEEIQRGELITNELSPREDIKVNFAGVSKDNLCLKTNGGRVLGITALSDTINDARELAYEQINKLRFKGEQFRGDIGQ